VLILVISKSLSLEKKFSKLNLLYSSPAAALYLFKTILPLRPLLIRFVLSEEITDRGLSYDYDILLISLELESLILDR
jgi:hypothetical protein